MRKIEQNSEDWYEWRRNGIGASDAPIIMGESKHATPHELFLEKVGLEPPKPVNEFITSLGHRFEPRALAYINLKEDKAYRPKIVEMMEYPWLRASLDGFYQTETLEIKYVGAAKLKAAMEESLVDLTHWIQMQHQMMVTGVAQCVYLCYTLREDYRDIDEIHYHSVPYDSEYVQGVLWPELFRFWEMVKAKEWIGEK